MSFDPNAHMMSLKGKDYLQVMWRLVWFREDHPDWCIDTICQEQDQEHAVFKCVICDENGIQKSSGHGSESKRDFGDFMEKAETKAVGRALAMLGYGTQFAPDLDEGDRIVDSPVNRAAKEDPDAFKPGDKIEAPKPGWSFRDAMFAWCEHYGINAETFGKFRDALVGAGIVDNIPSRQMSVDQFNALCTEIQKNFGDQLKVKS